MRGEEDVMGGTVGEFGAFEADPHEEEPMSFGEVSSMVAYLPRDAQAVAVSLVDNSKIREMIGDDLAESVELYYWLRDSGAGNADAYAALNEALHYSAGAHEMLASGDVREAYALAFLFRSKLCDAAYAVGMPELCEHTLAFGGTSTVGADPQWKVEERARRRAANRAQRDPNCPYNPGFGASAVDEFVHFDDHSNRWVVAEATGPGQYKAPVDKNYYKATGLSYAVGSLKGVTGREMGTYSYQNRGDALRRARQVYLGHGEFGEGDYDPVAEKDQYISRRIQVIAVPLALAGIGYIFWRELKRK